MILIEHSHLPVAAFTHPGMSGKNNEDRFSVTAYRLNEANPQPVLLAAVADGIGGHRAGEVAADLAVRRFNEILAASDGSNPQETLRYAIQTASNEIYALAKSEKGYHGMGSTWVCAWVITNRLYAATVGDSRLYLLRGGVIQQLSTDHTWIQEALEKGVLLPEQVSGHPNIHVIRRYMGSPNPPDVDFRLRMSPRETDAQAIANQGMALKVGDILLLCTDGLTDLVANEEIAQKLNTLPVEAALQALIELANQRGGHDNITVVAIHVPRRRARRRRGWLWLAAFLLVVALAVGLGVLLAQNSGRLVPPDAPTPTVQTTSPPPLVSPTLQGSPLPATVTVDAGQPASTQTLTQPVEGGATITPWPTNKP
jgi:serine/threonine protein phosphatase PrpC